MTDTTIVERASALLEDERAALVAADFKALEDVATRKEALFEELRRTRAPEASLARLRQAAERNAALLAASARGLRAVTRRIAEIRAATGSLRTYSQDGRAQTVGAGQGSLERRA